jgi:ABC-type uncharacterized transport system permease subunit
MSIQVLRFAALLYAGAAAAYVVFFARPRHARAATIGGALLAVAFLVHAIGIGLGCKEFGGTEFFTQRGSLVLLAWLLAGAYLVMQRLYGLPTVGAFVTPLVLVVLVPTLFGQPGQSEVDPDFIRSRWLLQAHIAVAVLGVALFAIAALVAVMYLLQEREVKGKHFGALFSRLPSLESLDRLNQRLVRAGFLVFTVALLAGTLVASQVWKRAWEWDPQQVRALLVWILYGALVQVRHLGWHGRRFALMTIAGFALLVGSWAALGAFPGATRHGGTYQ